MIVVTVKVTNKERLIILHDVVSCGRRHLVAASPLMRRPDPSVLPATPFCYPMTFAFSLSYDCIIFLFTYLPVSVRICDYM